MDRGSPQDDGLGSVVVMVKGSGGNTKRHSRPQMVIGALLVLITFILWRFSMMPHDATTRATSKSESTMLNRYLDSLHKAAVAAAGAISHEEESNAPTNVDRTESVAISVEEQQSEPEPEPIVCDDPIWCSIPMPKKSHFRLAPPTDAGRWIKAQAQAASGEHVLLNKIRQHFPNAFNFLDGDVKFAHYHYLVDHFVDKKNDLLPFVVNAGERAINAEIQHRSPKENAISEVMLEGSYSPEMPFTYLADKMDRAPIISLGYTRFQRFVGEPFFKGLRLEDKNVLRNRLFDIWERAKSQAGLKPPTKNDVKIDEKKPFLRTPIIFMSNLNENWGIFSMVVPNRTADWVNCCTPADRQRITSILDDDQVIAFFTQQHYNISHRKLISTPRGLSLQEHNNRLYLWDLMHTIPVNPSKVKTALVYTASSSWGYRPILRKCILDNFNAPGMTKLVEGKSGTEKVIEFDSYQKNLQGRVGESQYYLKLMNSRMTIALPGLGYDTYRLWESLTLGLVPVLERGVGLDKTVWKLPVLLVDDYADINESLLRSAYVEALYHVDDFEFERLTQSWWYTLILETSTSKSNAYLMEKFPPESEEGNFMRPVVPFNCWKTNSCGRGTKRIPKVTC